MLTILQTMAEKAGVANVSHTGRQRNKVDALSKTGRYSRCGHTGHRGFQIKKEEAWPDWCECAHGENRTTYLQAEVSRNM